MMKKPVVKPIIDAKGKNIDNIVACGHCGAFICYPEDHDKELIYCACDHCGMKIDWKGDVSNEND